MRRQTSPWAGLSVAMLLSLGVLALTTGQLKAQSFPTQLPAVAQPPYDPFELVTSQPKPAQTAKERTALYAQLQGIFKKRFFEANRVPYTVNISFVASGAVQEVGPGEMEETRNAAGVRRWTGHLGNYSLTRIIIAGTHDVGSAGPIPMRLHMAREYAMGPFLSPKTSFMRTANATLDGAALTCILFSERRSVAPGRDCSETEYCIDSQSELLRVYSTAPGIYVVYDYSGSSFHGHEVPDKVTVTEAGQIVLLGNITVKDPGSLDPALFTPTSQMVADGVQLVALPVIRHIQFRATGTAPSPPEPIAVHATLSPDGSVVEAEALQTTNLGLSRSAEDLVMKTKYDYPIPYSVPTQLEIFAIVQ